MLYKIKARNIITGEKHFFLTSDDDNDKNLKLENFIFEKLKNIFYKDCSFDKNHFTLIIIENKCFGCIYKKLDQASHSSCGGCLHDKKFCQFC